MIKKRVFGMILAAIMSVGLLALGSFGANATNTEMSAVTPTPTTTPSPTPTKTPMPTTTPSPTPRPSSRPSPTQQPAVGKFKDIDSGKWFNRHVNFVVESGLFNGIREDVFAPEDEMTRAMVITVLARHAGVSTQGGAYWYSNAVKWGVSNEITDGKNLDQPVTREELATMLYRYNKRPRPMGDLAIFADHNQISEWAGYAMKWAVGEKIIGGYNDRTVRPLGNATRAEVAAIIHRFVD